MSTTEPIDINLPGGFLRSTSRTAAQGRVIDGNCIRFQNGKWEKIGGWIRKPLTQLVGIVRGAFGWTTSSLNDLLAAGTQAKLYSIGDAVTDITPLRKTTSPLGNNPFTMTDTLTLVTVHDVGHGALDGATVTFSGASASHGITVVGTYILTRVDDDNYTIVAATPATSSGTGGGAAVVAAYEINVGLQDTAYGLGYGSGLYGRGTYGTERSATNGLSEGTGILNEMRTWSFANYGNKLMVSPSGGGIYSWDQPGAAARAVILAGAPTSVRYMFITPERMVVALGTTTPMTMAWSDRDDQTNWTPAADNTSDIRTLQVGNKLMAGATFSGGISVIWSDTAFFLMQFIDSTGEIYSTRVIAEGCGLLGPCAWARTPDLMAWMSNSFFFIYAGGIVQRAPRQDEIRDYILGSGVGTAGTTPDHGTSIGRLNRDKAAKVACGHDPKHNEVWWHYCSVDSTTGENDEYVLVCLSDWSWSTGKLDMLTSVGRSAMTRSESPAGVIYEAGTDSYIYQHENGVDANGAALPWFLQTGPIPAGNARTDQDVIGYVPDFERQFKDMTLQLRMWERPNSTVPLDDQTFTIAPEDILQDMKMGGRYYDMKLSADALGNDFRMGTPQLETGMGGDRR